MTEHLFSSRDGLHVVKPWSFSSIGLVPVLPCPVPFEIADADLMPARQFVARNEITQALRFVELCRLSSGSSSVQQWKLRLVAGMLQMELNRSRDAWHTLQAGLSWRNREEKRATQKFSVGVIEPREWLVMATIALGVGESETAESYASEAIARMEERPSCCLSDLLNDTRADAMSVYAAIRLSQQRYQEAEMLLQLAHDAFVHAGDMEQLVIGLILLADVEFYSGSTLAAKFLLCESDEILRCGCDVTRHFRVARIHLMLEQRLQAWCHRRPHRYSDASQN